MLIATLPCLNNIADDSVTVTVINPIPAPSPAPPNVHFEPTMTEQKTSVLVSGLPTPTLLSSPSPATTAEPATLPSQESTTPNSLFLPHVSVSTQPASPPVWAPEPEPEQQFKLDHADNNCADNNHASCKNGMYCDTHNNCYDCSFLSPDNCDANDGDCCSDVFLKQCPDSPYQCGANTKDLELPPLPPLPTEQATSEMDRGDHEEEEQPAEDNELDVEDVLSALAENDTVDTNSSANTDIISSATEEKLVYLGQSPQLGDAVLDNFGENNFDGDICNACGPSEFCLDDICWPQRFKVTGRLKDRGWNAGYLGEYDMIDATCDGVPVYQRADAWIFFQTWGNGDGKYHPGFLYRKPNGAIPALHSTCLEF